MPEFRARMIEDFEDAWGVSRTTFVAFTRGQWQQRRTARCRLLW